MAFIDESGKWIGPGPDPRQIGAAASPQPIQFNPSAIPTVSVPQGSTLTDWTNLLNANSGYQSWKGSAAQRADTASANRKAAIQAIATRYGGLPKGYSDVYGDVTPEIAQVAQSNPLSDTARINRDYGLGREQYKRSLAARGALQSGDLGYGLDQMDTQYASDIYDLNTQVADAVQQAINQYVGVLSGLSQEQVAELQRAASSVYDQGYRLGGGTSPADSPPYTPPPGTTPPPSEPVPPPPGNEPGTQYPSVGSPGPAPTPTYYGGLVPPQPAAPTTPYLTDWLKQYLAGSSGSGRTFAAV
jgi:hypothetical protein